MLRSSDGVAFKFVFVYCLRCFGGLRYAALMVVYVVCLLGLFVLIALFGGFLVCFGLVIFPGFELCWMMIDFDLLGVLVDCGY